MVTISGCHSGDPQFESRLRRNYSQEFFISLFYFKETQEDVFIFQILTSIWPASKCYWFIRAVQNCPMVYKHIISRSVFPNLLKVTEHSTIILMENPSYLRSNFIFQHSILWIYNFSRSTSRLLEEHLWSPKQWLGTTGLVEPNNAHHFLYRS